MSFGINQSTPALILLPDGLTASLLVNGIVERHFDATEIAETNDEIRTCRVRTYSIPLAPVCPDNQP